MLIALDYDRTFTADPMLFVEFGRLARERGHQVVCVTMRHESEPIADFPHEVVYTGRKAKKPHMAALGRSVSVWIDDSPEWILEDSP